MAKIAHLKDIADEVGAMKAEVKSLTDKNFRYKAERDQYKAQVAFLEEANQEMKTELNLYILFF